MRNSWSIISWQKITKLSELISSKLREKGRAPESGLGCGGIGCVIELAMAKQVYKNNDNFTIWLVGLLHKFLQFLPGGLSQKKFILFHPGYKVHHQLLHSRFCGSFVLFSNAKRKRFEFLVSNNY